MADINNLLPGDAVRWVLKNEIVPATVAGKSKALVCIEFEAKGETAKRWVSPKVLRLVWGGKKKLEREANAFQAAHDFVKAYSVGPKRLREVFEREKAAGRIKFDYGEIEARVIAYEQQFPRLKELLKGKNP